jgi:peptidoglycan/LPS O-acetylase OafA/YrhL
MGTEGGAILNSICNHHYIAELDGLRAFAILSVIFYHFGFNWAKGGFLGVDIFFVLSGYLVTSKILSSRENFKIKTFWKHRLCRILPSAYLMITVTVLCVVFFNHRLLANLLGDTISSISYTTNWWFIFHKLSYFDSFGSPSPFKHMWYLAVQEQFYILWPFILITGIKIAKKTNWIPKIIFIGALLSAALMSMLYNPDADLSRIYYGTDTRAFELLIGSFLAAVLANVKPFANRISIKGKKLLVSISIITFSIFIFSAVFIDEYNTFLYRGGLFLFSINSALLIACVCHSKGILNNILSWKPLSWIGTRSYEIYLWHYPIMVLSTPVYEINNPSWLRVFFQLAATCIIAELSYRFIEQPIHKLGFHEYCNYIVNNLFKGKSKAHTKKISIIVSVLVIISLAVGISCMAKSKPNSEKAKVYSSDISTAQISEQNSSNDKNTNMPAKNSKLASSKQNSINSNKPNSVIPNNIAASSSAPYKKILAIGDSVMIDITPALNKKYSNIKIDGKVGRQMREAIPLVSRYVRFNSPDKAVIIELGTNGYFTGKQIDKLLDSFSKSHIFLINTRVPRTWESTDNKILEEKAKERKNVSLIDWHSTAIEHPEYFGPDGVHLNLKGDEALVSLIDECLKTK